MLGLIKWMRSVFRSEPVHVFRREPNADEYLKHLVRIRNIRTEIARLRRNKKEHSHLQKELDALIDSGADTQTNNGDDQ